MKALGPYANRAECARCVSNVDGRCKTLIDTLWIRPHHECPFLATPERIKKDQALIKRKENDGSIQTGLYVLLDGPED